MVHERVEEIKDVQNQVNQQLTDLPENGTVKVNAHVLESDSEIKINIISKRIKGDVKRFDFSEKKVNSGDFTVNHITDGY